MENREKYAGRWENQYGSVMELDVDAEGRITGRFCTKVGRDETKDLWQGNWFDVVGFANGDLISFVVNYKTSGAMSSVSGRFVPGKKSQSGRHRIETMGHTSFDVPEEERWRGTSSTSVVYDKIV